MDACELEAFNQTATIYRPSAKPSGGPDRTFDDPFTIACHIEDEEIINPSGDPGQERFTRKVVLTAVEIFDTDWILLPNKTEQQQIRQVLVLPDEDGTVHHYEAIV